MTLSTIDATDGSSSFALDTVGVVLTVLANNSNDLDGDGYFDDEDGCPSEPETWNKYNDTDGCPDTLP